MEADQLQTIAASHLPTECELVAVASTPDGSGGYTQAETIKEATRCRMTGGVMSGEINAEVAAKLRGRTAYRYALPVGTSVVQGDRIAVGLLHYDVLSIAMAPGATLVRGLCAEV